MRQRKQVEFPIFLPIIIIIFVIIICILIKNILLNFDDEFLKNAIEISENNKNTQFKISKIVKYSSAEATDNSVEQNLSDISIHQYSDVALYIENIGEELTEKNTIKELYLDNFQSETKYEKGEHLFFYKNPLDISKFRMTEENKIYDRIDYKIISTNDENRSSNYDEPVFYADCSNPIVIGFVNKNIMENYNPEDKSIYFDGRILNNLNINVNEISPKISFTMHIKNNLDEIYGCELKIKFDIENNEGSIKSGYFIQVFNDVDNYVFFRER